MNTDEDDNPFIVYDENGEVYFEEDIDMQRTNVLKHLLDAAKGMKSEVVEGDLDSATETSSDYIVRLFTDSIIRYVYMFFNKEDENDVPSGFTIGEVNENGDLDYIYTETTSVDEIFHILVNFYDEKYEGIKIPEPETGIELCATLINHYSTKELSDEQIEEMRDKIAVVCKDYGFDEVEINHHKNQ